MTTSYFVARAAKNTSYTWTRKVLLKEVSDFKAALSYAFKAVEKHDNVRIYASRDDLKKYAHSGVLVELHKTSVSFWNRGSEELNKLLSA